ncbi:MAG: HipA domain-containing protein [Thiogranum sp.]
MRLAAELGLPVPDVSLRHLPEAIYLVSRFDRVVTVQGVQRRHQIDLCQLLNKWVGYKYESHGGVASRDLFDSLDQLVRPAVARDRGLRWMIFNYLIGNTDAHGKNLAFMVGPGGVDLAPFYDLLCVQAWLPDSTLAMSIHGENRPGWIEAGHWNALAAEAGVPASLLRSYLQRLSERVEAAADKVLGDDSFVEAEREFIAQNVIPVIRERVGYVQTALAETGLR